MAQHKHMHRVWGQWGLSAGTWAFWTLWGYLAGHQQDWHWCSNVLCRDRFLSTAHPAFNLCPKFICDLKISILVHHRMLCSSQNPCRANSKASVISVVIPLKAEPASIIEYKLDARLFATMICTAQVQIEISISTFLLDATKRSLGTEEGTPAY